MVAPNSYSIHCRGTRSLGSRTCSEIGRRFCRWLEIWLSDLVARRWERSAGDHRQSLAFALRPFYSRGLRGCTRLVDKQLIVSRNVHHNRPLSQPCLTLGRPLGPSFGRCPQWLAVPPSEAEHESNRYGKKPAGLKLGRKDVTNPVITEALILCAAKMIINSREAKSRIYVRLALRNSATGSFSGHWVRPE